MAHDRPPEYYDALRKLVELKETTSELRPLLPRDGPACESPDIELCRSHVVSVLRRYEATEISAEEVVDWAELLELRDGLSFEVGHEEALIQAIHELANPRLHGSLSPDRAQEVLAHLLPSNRPRSILDEEVAVIEAMLANTIYRAKFIPLDRTLIVYKMKDGGMGSLRFVTNESRDARYGKEIATAAYTDSDGVYVSLAVNIDQYGDLFELDVWKVDNMPLKRWPKPEDLQPVIAGPAT